MKTVNSILLVTLFCLGVVFLNTEEQQHAHHPASFLPDDILVYIEENNGQDSFERLLNSPLSEVLAQINYPRMANELGLTPASLKLIETLRQVLTLSRSGDLVSELFGQRVVLALLNKRSWFGSEDGVEGYLKKHAIVICQPANDHFSVEQLLEQHFPAYPKSTVLFGRHTLYRLAIDTELIMAISYVDGQLLISFEERVLREALALREHNQQTFFTSPEFEQLATDLSHATRTIYCQIKQLQEVVKSLALSLASEKERMVAYSLVSFPGIQSLGYGAGGVNGIDTHKLFVQLDPEIMDSPIGEMIAPPPSMNFSLPFVSKDTLLYYWSNSLELSQLWQMYTEQIGTESDDVASIVTDLESLFGTDLRTLFDAFGTNVGIVVEDSVLDTFVPIPDFAILLRLNDSEEGGRAIDYAFQQLDLHMSEGDYRQIPYFAWGLNPNEPIQPVYTIYRDYLIVANTLTMLKRILDTPISADLLVENEEFQRLDPGFQTLNNSVCYVNQSRLLFRLRELFSWGGTMVAIQDRQAAEKSKFLLDNLIDPIFSGLDIYEKSATRTYVKNERIYIESNILVQEL